MVWGSMVRLEIGPQDLNFIRKLDVCTSDVTGFQTGKKDLSLLGVSVLYRTVSEMFSEKME